jgi:hypothetical protein
MITMTDPDNKQPPKNPGTWLIYLAIILAGLLFLAEAFQFTHLNRWTARVGIALLYSAFALLVGNGRRSGYIAMVIIWIPTVGIILYQFFY